MNKKSIDPKVLGEIISAKRKEGKKNQEIYNDLAPEYYNKESLALFIIGTITDEQKLLFKTKNNLLIALLGLGGLSKIIYTLIIAINANFYLGLVFAFLAPIINIGFILPIRKFKPGIYKLCGGLTIAFFLQSLQLFNNPIEILINFAYSGLIAGIAFNIHNSLFSWYNPKYLNKDENGVYKITNDIEETVS